MFIICEVEEHPIINVMANNKIEVKKVFINCTFLN
jgi:hypothetical protein